MCLSETGISLVNLVCNWILPVKMSVSQLNVNLKNLNSIQKFIPVSISTVDLCRPMLVRVLSEIEDFNRRSESEPLFLRVNQTYILEVDMHQGCVKSRFELDSLRQVTTSQIIWTEKVRYVLSSSVHINNTTTY